MPKKTIVLQNLAELLDVYRNTPHFTDEAGNPDPDGCCTRLPDGRLTRVMVIQDGLTALVTGGERR
jgi:hypothetical protein